MSHLARVIAYRETLTEKGVTCPIEQASFCQEAYIRAIVADHVKYCGDFSFTEDQESLVWNQLDKWNSVAPIQARLILESAKLRLHRVKVGLIQEGKTPGNEEFAVNAQITEVIDGVDVPRNICVTGNDQFKNLFDYLCVELRDRHE